MTTGGRPQEPGGQGREPFPEALPPMLATLATDLPGGDQAGWVYELKWDGYRALGAVRGGAARFTSRRGNDMTARWPQLQEAPPALSGRDVLLDGEVVAFDEEGRPNFGVLQQPPPGTPIAYLVFDVLHVDGRSTRELPWTERRRILEGLELQTSCWQVPGCWDDGPALRQASRERRLEGVIAKRRNSLYLPGRRSREWLKVKNTARQELVIGGWLPGSGNRSGRLGALLVGYYESGGPPAGPGAPAARLQFAGKVGTGFSQQELDRLQRELEGREIPTSPFAEPVPHKGCRFVRPELVAEVEFVEWTHQGILRAPSYKGLREDKEPHEVRKETAVPGD